MVYLQISMRNTLLPELHTVKKKYCNKIISFLFVNIFLIKNFFIKNFFFF